MCVVYRYIYCDDVRGGHPQKLPIPHTHTHTHTHTGTPTATTFEAGTRRSCSSLMDRDECAGQERESARERERERELT
jgi:hypothetical protein